MNPTLINSCISNQIKALEQLKAVTENKQYAELYDKLSTIILDNYSSGRIVISGVGKNANIASKISETFASLGLRSSYLNACHYSHGDAGFIGPNDHLICISKSGKTAEITNLLHHLASTRPNIGTTLIHCNDSDISCVPNTTGQLALGNITEGDEHNLAPTTSTTAILCVLDTMAVSLSSEIDFTPNDFLMYHPGGSLGQKLTSK